MDAITLKLPEALHTALANASRQRGVSKSEIVREALAASLESQGYAAGAAGRWVEQWRGRLQLPALPAEADADARGRAPGAADDGRLAQLLAKHVR